MRPLRPAVALSGAAAALVGLALAAAGSAADEARPHIDRFALAGGAAETRGLEIVIELRVAGGAEAYRLSEDPRLLGTEWLPYTPTPRFRLAPRGEERRTVYVQVRRGGSVSFVASDDIVYRPPAAEYALPLGEAHAFARAGGWRFAAEAGNPASLCRLSANDDALVLSAARQRAGVDAVCDFVLFGDGPPLAAGWRVAGLRRTRTDRPSCGYRFLHFPVEGGADIGFHIRIVDADAETGELRGSCAYAIRRLVLRGPADADWRDAFRP